MVPRGATRASLRSARALFAPVRLDMPSRDCNTVEDDSEFLRNLISDGAGLRSRRQRETRLACLVSGTTGPLLRVNR